MEAAEYLHDAKVSKETDRHLCKIFWDICIQCNDSCQQLSVEVMKRQYECRIIFMHCNLIRSSHKSYNACLNFNLEMINHFDEFLKNIIK